MVLTANGIRVPLVCGLLLTVAPFFSLPARTGAAGAVKSQKSSVAGDLRLHQFRSEVFGNTRTIRVLLPRGYDERVNRNRRYPVLYLNDGQNLFDAATSVCWKRRAPGAAV